MRNNSFNFFKREWNKHTTIGAISNAFCLGCSHDLISLQFGLVVIVMKKLGFSRQCARARAFMTWDEHHLLEPKKDAGRCKSPYSSSSFSFSKSSLVMLVRFNCSSIFFFIKLFFCSICNSNVLPQRASTCQLNTPKLIFQILEIVFHAIKGTGTN